MDTDTKTFGEDKTYDSEKNNYTHFKIVYTYFANGNFEMCLSESKNILKFLGTYRINRFEDNKYNIDIFATSYRFNEEPQVAYSKEFYTYNYEDGTVTNYRLEDIVYDIYSYPPFFPEDLIKENMFFDDFEINYTFFTDGKIDMLMSKTESKTKETLKLTGTYGRSPKKFDQVDVIFSQYELNNEPQREYFLECTLWLRSDGKIQNCYLKDIIVELFPIPKTFEEDKKSKVQTFQEFQVTYTYFADGKFELHLKDVQFNPCEMKFLGTYMKNPREMNDYDVSLSHFQFQDQPMKEYTKKISTYFFSDGEVGCGYANQTLKEIIEENYSYPKFFVQDRILDHENFKYNDFKVILHLFKNGKFDLTMTEPEKKLLLSGTYERHPHDKNICYGKISKAKKNEDPEIDYNETFRISIYDASCGYISLYDLDKTINDLCPLPKWFSEDTVKAYEKNRFGDFLITYSFFAKGNFEMVLFTPKCKLTLLGTYEKHPTNKRNIHVSITQFQLDDNPVGEHVEQFEVYLKDDEQETKCYANFGQIVHLLCNSSFDSTKLESGKPFTAVCHATNRHYESGSRCSYDSEDLLGLFYPDGTVSIKTHLEYYEDWGTDYDMSPSCTDYSATGDYVFLEKNNEGDILVRITQIESKNFQGKEVEAKIVPGSFSLFIKGENFINKKFYY